MKRFLAMILILALVLSVPIAPAAATQEENVTVVGETCPCGCGKAASEINWKPYNVNVEGAPADGHYYLSADYAQKQQFTIMAGDRVVIDLRGYTLNTSGYSRLFLVYGYLAVMDTVGGGRMCSKTSGGAYGGVVMVSLNETADSTFAFHSGTLTVDSDNKSSLAGGIVTVGNGCHFIMYDGLLLGGSTTERGGAIRAQGAKSDVQILGGSVIGGKSATAGGIIWSQGKVTLKDCLLSGGQANGETNGYGGNVYVDGGSLTVENATIESGRAYRGGNIYTASGCKVSIKDSTIRNGYAEENGGNLYFGKGTQHLENVKIQSGVAAGKGAHLYKSADASLTTVGCQYAPTVGSTCPHCKQAVTWEAAGETLSGHCYLTGDKTISAAYTITGDVVLDLRGNDITSSERAFKIESGASLMVIDTVGGGTVKGSGVEGEAGGVIHNSGVLSIYGGNFRYVAGKTVTSGGVIYTAGNVSLNGGLFDSSAFSNTADTAFGGVLHMAAGKKSFTMTSGHVLGGSAYDGGSFYFSANNTVNITGGTFSGGTAVYAGGIFRFNGNAVSTMINATLSGVYMDGGVANGSGNFAGNMFIGCANVTLNDCVLINGSGYYGGNLACGTRGFLTANRTVFANGVANRGGNIYNSSYVSGANFTDSIMVGGRATGSAGGNIMANQGNVNFYGGMIAYGYAKTTGGNVHANSGNHSHNDAKDDGFRLYASQKGMPIVTGGKSDANGGNIYSCGILVLDAAFIHNGSATNGKDLYYANGANAYSLTVGAGLTGNISLGVSNVSFNGSELVNATAVAFPGKLILESKNGQSLTVKNGKLVLGTIAVVSSDGSTQWVADMATAQAAYQEGGYIRIFADTTVELTKDCAIDLNGKTLTVSGDYTLYGMDSSGDDYTVGTGKVILNENAKAAARTTVADGREYLAITEGNTATYHRLGMALTDVTLRTATCGIYYKASWACDSQLAALVAGYGIALSVYKQPNENFATDSQVMTVDYDGADLVSGQKQTSISINNIMKDNLSDASNDKRGQMPIYANAYLQLTDGTKIMSSGADYSLKTTMEKLDHLIATDPTMFRRYTNDARAFYETWRENGMNNWNFTEIPTPEEDDVLDILMIGSSGCYYYVEELWGMLDAVGIKARVCNVYYSGCNLVQHYNWWVGNQSNYQFYVTDENGRRGTNNVSLEYCLAQGNWDVISLQESSAAKLRVGEAQTLLAERKVYLDALYGYLREQFPKADLYWHENGAYQKGYNQSFKIETVEQQAADTWHFREFAKAIAAEYDVQWIPRGEASQIYREIPGIEDNLCARLAINNGEGDYYHDGDIGGGQYLTASVWFEMLTGQSIIGNTWRPDYELAEEKILLLQQCGHQAVEKLKNGEY